MSSYQAKDREPGRAQNKGSNPYWWPLQENALEAADIQALLDLVRSGARLTQFEFVRQFESEFAKWQGAKHAVFVNSGSSANLLLAAACMELLGWNRGDEVLVPAVTWPTTITPFLQLGLEPVFVDVSLHDFGMAEEELLSSVNSRTKAVAIAHLLGFPASAARTASELQDTGIAMLEDCCESQGAELAGTKVGNLGMGGTFSFYWGHHMTTIEGGMVCTNDDSLYELLLLKRSHGLARELPAASFAREAARYGGIDSRFLFLTDGFNFRSTELNAALGISQLKRIDSVITKRNENYQYFVDGLAAGDAKVHEHSNEGLSSFVLPLVWQESRDKVLFQETLIRAGIETRPIISGNLLRQPFVSRFGSPKNYPNAEVLHQNGFYVGNNQFVSRERINKLVDLLSSC